MINTSRASITPPLRPIRSHRTGLSVALAIVLGLAFAANASANADPDPVDVSADQARRLCGAAWEARGYRDGLTGQPVRDHPFGDAEAAAAACRAAGANAPDFKAYRAEHGAGRFLSGRRDNLRRALEGAPSGAPALDRRDKTDIIASPPAPSGLLNRRGARQDALRRRYDAADRRLNRRELSPSLSRGEQTLINRNRREIDRQRRLNEIVRPSPALR
ncbi:MAG: hypothetical protein KTR21_15670 [Rhodobacteraceae bacterium]|nr:hypothetical protein [Paracoccaceae bacterium]